MSRTAVSIHLSPTEQALLLKIHRKLTIPEFQKERIQIVLAASTGLQNKDITAQYGYEVHRVGKWRNRWAKAHQHWQNSDPELRPKMSETLVLCWLADKKGRGRKNEITLDQRAKIAALSQETPSQNGIPVTHWTLASLAEVSAQRGIVDSISQTSVHRILKKTTCRRTDAATG